MGRERQEFSDAEQVTAEACACKQCSKCNLAKPLSEFSKDSRVGHKAACKACRNAETRAYQAANKDKKHAAWQRRKADPIRHQRKLAGQKQYRDAERALVPGWDRKVQLHDAHVKTYGLSSRVLHDAHVRARTEALKPRLHDAHVREFKSDAARLRRWRYHNDMRYMLYHRVKRWMHKHLADQLPSRKWSAALGYTTTQLRAHLERQFTPGMSWANKGEWHIDHIVPVASFEITSLDSPEFKACFGMHNLRPMWGTENLKKGKRRDFLL